MAGSPLLSSDANRVVGSFYPFLGRCLLVYLSPPNGGRINECWLVDRTMMQCFRYCVNTGGAGSEIVRKSKVVTRLPSESGGCDRWLRCTLLLARVPCKDRTSLLAFFLHLHAQLSAIKINPRYSALAAVEGPERGVHK